MNEEIKEVLEALDKIAKGVHYPEDLLYYENCQTLLDYITNLQEENERLNNIINKKDYKIKRIVYSCYESDMSYDEFKRIWVNAFGKLYDPKDIDELEKVLKGEVVDADGVLDILEGKNNE